MVDYSGYFIQVQRISGARRNVKILRSDKILDFISEVSRDAGMDKSIRLITVLAAGTGARISEILDIRKRDVRADGFFKLRVLKKDRSQIRKDAKLRKEGKIPPPWYPVWRTCKIPGGISADIFEIMKHRRPVEKLFKINRHQALYGIKQVFGDDTECHGFRHSFLSWMMTLGMPEQKVADLVKLETDTVQTYSHLTDVEKVWGDIGT